MSPDKVTRSLGAVLSVVLVASPIEAQDLYWSGFGSVNRLTAGGHALPLTLDCVETFTADPATASIYYMGCLGGTLNRLDLRSGRSTIVERLVPADQNGALMAFDSNRQILYWVYDPPRTIFRMRMSDLQPEIVHRASERLEDLTVNQADGRLYWVELRFGWGQNEPGFGKIFTADATWESVDAIYENEWNGGFLTFHGPHQLEIDPYDRRAFLQSSTTVLNNIPMVVDYLNYFDLDDPVPRTFHTTVAGYKDLSLDVVNNSLFVAAVFRNPAVIQEVSLNHCLNRPFCIPGDVVEMSADKVWVDSCERVNHPRNTDLVDFVLCATGPDKISSRACYCSDLYLDRGVDLADYAVFQRIYLGN